MEPAAAIPVAPFQWRDGERLIVFGRGRLAEAPELIGSDYVLLSTARAADLSSRLREGASAVHEVEAGQVDELAGTLRSEIGGETLVALGGGRVIDVAKALAAAEAPRRVVAIPTTLSGAEMTPIHRRAAGADASAPGVRPAVVINDPALSASQPAEPLAQSAGNALGHAVEGPATPLRNPVAQLTGIAAAQLIARGFSADGLGDDERDALALAALLAGYAIGSAGYGLHHVLSQTLVRFAGVGHGAANTIMLPVTTQALADRNPAWIARLAGALGGDPVALAERLRSLGGLSDLRSLGVTAEALETCVEQASRRPELQMTPPAASVAEIRDLYAAAYC